MMNQLRLKLDENSEKTVLESYADLEGMRKLLTKQGVYTDLAGYDKFRRLKNVNSDFRDHNISIGLSTADNEWYSNELYFDIFGGDELSFLSSQLSLSGNLVEIDFFKNINFETTTLNKLNQYINDLAPLGLSLPGAAREAVASNRAVDVGPYGFGYLNIPNVNYNQDSKLMESGIDPNTNKPILNTLRVKISHPNSISMPIINEANKTGAFESVTKVNTKETDQNGDPFHFYDFKVKNNQAAHGYFSVINNLSSSSRFRVDKIGPSCDSSSPEKYLYSDLFNGIQYNHCTSCNVDDKANYHYYPDTRMCEYCDSTDSTKIWNEAKRKCDTCDLSIPDNHYFADTQQCFKCWLSDGYKIHDPGTGLTKKCEYCPTGTMRDDGTCDWPVPTLTLTPNFMPPPEPDDQFCSTSSVGQWYEKRCFFEAKCDGGEITTSIYFPTILYRCDSNEWVKYSDPITITVTCENPEKESVSQTLKCE